MSRYSYIARDMDGAVVNGVMEAGDERDVRSRLRKRGFYATSITAAREWHLWRRRRRKVKADEIAIFAEQLAVMIDAGLPLVRCLAALSRQNKSESLKRIIDEIRQDVENGVSLADSLTKYPRAFPNLFVSLVRAGEVGGALDKVLRQLADYLDKEQQTRQKVRSALVYPKIVAFFCVAAAVFILSFVIPRFAVLYDKLGLKLPLPTVILIGTSEFMLSFWWAVLGGVVGIILICKKVSTSVTGREVLDRIKLRLPMFGDLNRKIAISRFIRVLGALDTSGVPITQSLEVAGQIVNNVVIDRIIDRVRMNVRAGGNLEEPISASDIFPSMVVQMVAVGEEAGRLGQALEKSANYLERELDATVKRLITRLEPALTIIVAMIVALFALAVYLPMFDVIKGISGS